MFTSNLIWSCFNNLLETRCFEIFINIFKMPMCGGLLGVKVPSAEDAARLTPLVKLYITEKTQSSSVEILEHATQMVAGINHFVKVRTFCISI